MALAASPFLSAKEGALFCGLRRIALKAASTSKVPHLLSNPWLPRALTRKDASTRASLIPGMPVAQTRVTGQRGRTCE